MSNVTHGRVFTTNLQVALVDKTRTIQSSITKFRRRYIK